MNTQPLYKVGDVVDVYDTSLEYHYTGQVTELHCVDDGTDDWRDHVWYYVRPLDPDPILKGASWEEYNLRLRVPALSWAEVMV